MDGAKASALNAGSIGSATLDDLPLGNRSPTAPRSRPVDGSTNRFLRCLAKPGLGNESTRSSGLRTRGGDGNQAWRPRPCPRALARPTRAVPTHSGIRISSTRSWRPKPSTASRPPEATAKPPCGAECGGIAGSKSHHWLSGSDSPCPLGSTLARCVQTHQPGMQRHQFDRSSNQGSSSASSGPRQPWGWPRRTEMPPAPNAWQHSQTVQ